MVVMTLAQKITYRDPSNPLTRGKRSCSGQGAQQLDGRGNGKRKIVLPYFGSLFPLTRHIEKWEIK